MSGYYMVCLDLRGKDCLVVGRGHVATEKTRGLIEAGAHVSIVAPEVDEELAGLPVVVHRRPFTPSDVVGRFVIFATTDDRSLNARVSAVAAERCVPCNVADDPELCSFILPAIVREGPIVAGVFTGGASPALAQRLRDDFAHLLRPEHAKLAERLAELRPWAKEQFDSYEERRDFFQQLVAEALG